MPENKVVTVQRANVVLQISEALVDRYIDQGYDVIDANGNVIKASIPRDLGTLQKAYVDHLQEIDALKKEIEQLKQKKVGRTKK